MTIRVFLSAFVVFLVGCATPGARSPHSESASVELPVSRQATSNDRQQSAKVHAELGQLYLQQGSYEVALDEARIALESDVSYAPAHNLRGLAYMAIGKNALAEESFRRALSLARNDPEINNDFGWFLCQTGRPKDSIEMFQVAIGNPLYNAPVRALANAGICSLRYQADREAESYFLRVIRLDRKHITALYWLADIAYRGNRYADAQMRLKELHVAIEPLAQSAWLALRLARKMGDRDEEARMLGIMRRKYRDSPEHQKLSRGEFD
ncbi:MAG: type IV pilus biogenesis/stability protein PilW [Rhodocyclaceae bacterium]|nr:type IV pilus biogenesis/stability protein PilW [Rhodocyclaceae bacterium]MDZ4214094.1 type IV pilus biogenesis/stability protein PilW [Rhodocyclaceae bacterium]